MTLSVSAQAVVLTTELQTFLRVAAGDLAVLVGLLALRQAERGGPGRELGVLSVPAPTLWDQAQVAARSFRNHERRVAGDLTIPNIRDPQLGVYSDEFLTSFSHRWAPIHGADNDPHQLNANHVRNLTQATARITASVLATLDQFGLA